MFSALRKRMHLNPATAIATLALVFAMTGGAYAASKYLITSTKQISPKVLKSLKGKAGAKGANGANGANGAGGPQGPAGPQGPGGPQGPAGGAGPAGGPGPAGESVTNKAVTPGATCKEGGAEFKVGSGTATKACNGTTGFTETLPSGKTETGTWSTIYAAAAEGDLMSSSISFTIPLAEAPENAQFIKATGTPLAGCSGTAAKPEAAPGNLCVFASAERFAKEIAPGAGNLGTPTTAYGSTVIIAATKATTVIAGGTWAVTAK
jgi:hypothetical protein